jgi:hypothetical protein
MPLLWVKNPRVRIIMDTKSLRIWCNCKSKSKIRRSTARQVTLKITSKSRGTITMLTRWPIKTFSWESKTNKRATRAWKTCKEEPQPQRICCRRGLLCLDRQRTLTTMSAKCITITTNKPRIIKLWRLRRRTSRTNSFCKLYWMRLRKSILTGKA